MRSTLFVAVYAVMSASLAHAQIAVQQPVIGVTGVATAVSVPDRGTTLLGGVSSAESFRQSYGPLRTGTSRGYGLTGGSITASVRIIDLREMDEAILNSAPGSPTPVTIRKRAVTGPTEAVATQANPTDKAANFERMAQLADAAGKPGVARLHWQMAAKYGSTIATEKLKASIPDPSRATAQK